MINIEDYEPFLIGIKLMPGLPLDTIKKDMKKILSSNSYKVPVEPLEMPFRIGPPSEPLGYKDDVEVRLNLEKEAFNLFGDTPELVKEIFEPFTELISDLKFEKDEIIFFYEIFSTMGIKTDENPLNIFSNSINADISNLESINPKISFSGLHISTYKTDLDEEDSVSIVIEPKKGSESSRYQVSVRFQTKNLENILKFDLEDEIIPILNSLEGN